MYTIQDVIKSLERYETEKHTILNRDIFINSLQSTLSKSIYKNSYAMQSSLCNHLIRKEHNKDRTHATELLSHLKNNGIKLRQTGSEVEYIHLDTEKPVILLSSKLSAIGDFRRVWQRLNPNTYTNKEPIDIIWSIGDWRTTVIIPSNNWQEIQEQKTKYLYLNKDGTEKGYDLNFFFYPARFQIMSPRGQHLETDAARVLNRWDLLDWRQEIDIQSFEYKRSLRVLQDAYELLKELKPFIERSEQGTNADELIFDLSDTKQELKSKTTKQEKIKIDVIKPKESSEKADRIDLFKKILKKTKKIPVKMITKLLNYESEEEFLLWLYNLSDEYAVTVDGENILFNWREKDVNELVNSLVDNFEKWEKKESKI